jgi:hypothetical protein
VSDWREGYLICEHLAADPDLDLRGNAGRCCCAACYEIQDADGVPILLHGETISNGGRVRVERRGDLAVMSLDTLDP